VAAGDPDPDSATRFASQTKNLRKGSEDLASVG
jgi:hypothetical protein